MVRVFVGYQTPSKIALYFEIMRIKTKAVKLKFFADETTFNLGDNIDSERSLNSPENGDAGDNVGGIVWVSDDPTIKLVRNSDEGNVVDEDNDLDGVTSVHPLLIMTPR